MQESMLSISGFRDKPGMTENIISYHLSFSDTIFSLPQACHPFSIPFFLLLSLVGESLVILNSLFSLPLIPMIFLVQFQLVSDISVFLDGEKLQGSRFRGPKLVFLFRGELALDVLHEESLFSLYPIFEDYFSLLVHIFHLLFSLRISESACLQFS